MSKVNSHIWPLTFDTRVEGELPYMTVDLADINCLWAGIGMVENSRATTGCEEF